MENLDDLLDRIIQKNQLGQPPAPGASFTRTPEELEQGRAQARDAFRVFPEVDLPADNAALMATQRYPAMSNVFTLFGQGIEQSPGLIPGVEGTPVLWNRVAELDRLSGRLIWCGQLFTNGGDAGALTTAAAAQGLCEGTIKKAEDLIAAPDTSEINRNFLRAAFCEPLRLLAERKDREAQAQKTLVAHTHPLQEQVDQTQERAAMTRAIDGFLSSGGTP